MNRAYVRLAVALVAAGLLLGIAARLPRRPDPAPPPPPSVEAQLIVTVRSGGEIRPESSAVEKNAAVTLVAANETDAPVAFSLAGYEDRVRVEIPAGRSRRVRFVADRPGEDFAWVVDGAPRGRLRVTGSHLIEGHR